MSAKTVFIFQNEYPAINKALNILKQYHNDEQENVNTLNTSNQICWPTSATMAEKASLIAKGKYPTEKIKKTR